MHYVQGKFIEEICIVVVVVFLHTVPSAQTQGFIFEILDFLIL